MLACKSLSQPFILPFFFFCLFRSPLCKQLLGELNEVKKNKHHERTNGPHRHAVAQFRVIWLDVSGLTDRVLFRRSRGRTTCPNPDSHLSLQLRLHLLPSPPTRCPPARPPPPSITGTRRPTSAARAAATPVTTAASP